MHKDIKKGLLEYFDKLLKETPKIPSLPDAKPPELYKINIEYPLIPLFAYANIYYDLVNDELVYNVIEPVLERDEELLIKHIKEEIINKIYQDVDNLTDKDKEEILLDLLLSTIKRYKIKYNKESLLKIFYYLWRDMIGLEKVEPLMHDPFIEDISCDGYDIPIYVNHRKYGILRTNILFTKNELERFVIKLAQKSGKYISYAEPLLDATLPDGSRVNATYSSDVTTR
ncbi:MAG TPA: secretion system protein E, partial [Candidatus Nanopusillus sp.]|nr:secretion system protein E [Candidatus Nanopusillus sp.]